MQGFGDQSRTTRGRGRAPRRRTRPRCRTAPTRSSSGRTAARLYAVIVDNTELHDVDIFDITDPRDAGVHRRPRPVRARRRAGRRHHRRRRPTATIFLHDMVVKQIGGVPIMLASYWDAGYVKLDVADPANPTSSSATPPSATTDPLTVREGRSPPEGNGHEAEFSHDNKFVLAADEDFAPYRPLVQIDHGPTPASTPSASVGGGAPPRSLPGPDAERPDASSAATAARLGADPAARGTGPRRSRRARRRSSSSSADRRTIPTAPTSVLPRREGRERHRRRL